MAQLKTNGPMVPRSQGGDRKSARIEAEAAFISGLVKATPDITLEELRPGLNESDVSVAVSTIWWFSDRELFNAMRYVIRYGIAWRAMPNDFPPWAAVYQQMQRWMAAQCFEALVQDLRALLRLASGRKEEPTAAIIDSRTLRSTPESGPRAGYDGAKRKRGSKVHLAVDTLGHLLALHVTPADVGDRAAVARLAADVQEATGDNVTLALVDQGYTGEAAAEAANAEGITLHVVKLPEAKRGFVLLPRRWAVERSFA